MINARCLPGGARRSALPLAVVWAMLCLAGTICSADEAGRAAEQPGSGEVRLLWPDGAPQGRGDSDADRPVLFVFLPEADKATGTGVVVCPGGGYGGHAMDHEGVQVARFLNSIGVAAFVLRYRLSPYRHPIPLQDAQRAIRLVRAEARRYGLAADRIGIMGFSAGGHLASTAGTHFDLGREDAEDPVERVSSRPDFLVLCYPVISLSAPFAHQGSRRNLLGDRAPADLVEHLSSEKQVTAQTPPTFLFHTDEDTGVLPENSVAFYLALRRAGVPAEMHIYQRGPHGVGLIPGDPVLSSWSRRLADWLQTNGLLSDAPRAAVRGTVKIDGQDLSFGAIAFRSERPGQGHPVAVARVQQGGFELPQDRGPVVGPCTVVITHMSAEVISKQPTLSDAVSVQQKAEIRPGENVLKFELARDE